MNRRFARKNLAIFLALCLAGARHVAVGCDFCGPQTTLSDEFNSAGAVVIARLLATPQRPAINPDKPEDLKVELRKSRFEIVDVLKGKEALGDTREIEALYLGENPPGTPFLIQASAEPELAWGIPWGLNDRAVTYLLRLSELPDAGEERLRFFLEYLQDEDDMLARDAYGEFARVPYDELKVLRGDLNSDELLGWIADPRTVPSFRPLYLMLLAIVEQGQPRPEALRMLEELIAGHADNPLTSLNAVIACYLTLKGPAGLPLIEEKFLANKDCQYSDTQAAIGALRFHVNEEQVIPQDQALAAMRLVLDRPEMADIVIPDLARAEDWSVLPRLVALAKDSDEKSYWVRTPVIQYLMACPLPEAAAAVEEFKQLDPEAVKRASFFVPRLASEGPRPVPPALAPADEAPADVADPKPAPDELGGDEPRADGDKPPADGARPGRADSTSGSTAAAKTKTDRAADQTGMSAGNDAAGTAQAAGTATSRYIALIPLAAGLGLFIVLYSILRGGRRLANQVPS